ncbi:retrotransposable element [Pimephales promelas]|nr:retrotransposable element [Pimephales promelas]
MIRPDEDPADEMPVRTAVEIQGAMLGRHEEELAAAHQAVRSLAAQVSDLSARLLHQDSSSFPNRQLLPEPRINNPSGYAGEPTQCRAFLIQCEIVFSLQPQTYAEDRARIAYVLSLLTGRAREWGTSVWETQSACCRKYQSFKDEMIKVFDRSVFGSEASRLLAVLRQGKRSVADFAIEFRTLATTSEWNEPAQIARFLEGLNLDLKEEIYARGAPSQLDQLIDLAIRLDKCFEQRRRVRSPFTTTCNTCPSVTASVLTQPDAEPMQVGGVRISSEERQRRIVNRLCLYCATALALIDSGAEGNFIDEKWAREHKIPLIDLTEAASVFSLDGRELSSVRRVTSPEEPDDLSGVPEEYHDLRAVFSRSRAVSLPPHRPYDCSIELLPNTTPPRGRLYSLSAPEREALEKYLTESLDAGIIVPSSSPAGAGFFFVKKKDGSLRPCIDYRGLNNITVKNRYPLPLMSSAFEILQGAKIFTKLDLRNAYHLVRIKEGDKWKTAFNTPVGHFENRVLPFGLVNAPAVFQALVNDVLRDILNVFVFVYLDDIFIFSPSLQVHVQHVRRVLKRLLENRLFVKAEKCVFHALSVTFLCSVVSAEGISMDPDKVRAVLDWAVPDSRVALQRFLGFANFYRCFICNFSQVAAPLTALTSSKTRFVWSGNAQDAFDRLKRLFTSAPILITPDPKRQFIVEVDASEIGVGAVLSRLYSHRLSPAERNYDVGNRELLAIRLALGEWRHWLEGASVPFIVWTDHRNLEYIRSAKRLNARQARWALFFDRFDFSISFRPGSKNLKPDALSRQFDSSEGASTDERVLPPRCVVGVAVWGVEQAVKRALSHITRVPRSPEGTLYVPEAARLTVLRWGHSSKLVAHPGVRGTLSVIRQRFWWPTRERDIRRFVAACSICAQTKSSNKPPAGLLRPLPIPSRPWSHIALDFVTGLPRSAGNTVILTVVDRFSKAAHFIRLPKLPSAQETAQIMVDHVFKIHGLPSDIVSDRGPQFTSQVWREFCRQIGASASLSSGFHPQTNGQAERTNQILGRMLRCLTSQNGAPVSWCDQLSWAEYAHNSLPSSATGFSPFEGCLGYQPPVFSSQES